MCNSSKPMTSHHTTGMWIEKCCCSIQIGLTSHEYISLPSGFDLFK
jgi:hypothetical protein